MMTIDETIARAKEISRMTKTAFPESSEEQSQLAGWLEELKNFREHKNKFAGKGMSICILTYNVMFYNKLALRQIRALTKLIPYEILMFDNGSTDGSTEWLEQQPDVNLVRNQNEYQLRHGAALDYLVRHVAKYPIVCTLCSDAFPMSVEWIVPAMHLNERTYLAGIERGYGRITDNYVCPSYLFGWTDWLREHSFCDQYPTTDTGEQLTKDCIVEGKEIKLWKAIEENCDGTVGHKRCNYSNLVWHVWWGGRSQSVPSVVGVECEVDYQDRMKEFLRKKHNLDF